jgi:O-antigen/teichoic acid export membrane protein
MATNHLMGPEEPEEGPPGPDDRVAPGGGSQRSGRQRLAREGGKFLKANVLATGSTLVAGLLGFVLQAVAGHALHPGEYAKASAVVSFYVVLTPGAAFGRLVAWQTSHDLSTPDRDLQKSGVLLREVTVRLLIGGGLVVVVSSIIGPLLGSFMHVPIRYIIVGSIAVPFTLAAQPLLGRLQGEQRFVPWSLLNVLITFSRLVFVIALVFGFGAFGVIAGTTIGSVVTFAVCLALLWPAVTAYKGRFPWRPTIPFIVIGLVSTLCIGVFVSVNTILVEHFFNKVQSGQFAAVVVLGNAVYFLTGGFATAVFPMVVARHARDRSTLGVMGASLALCAAAGLAGALVLQLFGHVILLDFAGKAYVGGAYYLGWYAVGMAVLGCAIVLVYTQQSLNRLNMLWVLIPVTLLRPILIVMFHRTLMTVVVVSDLSVTGFALAMLVLYVFTERARLRSEGGPDGTLSGSGAASFARSVG